MGANNNKLTTKCFIEKANLKHSNFYDYSLVKYINSGIKVEIICPDHGPFWQLPSNHLSGQGCMQCGFLKKKIKKTLTSEQFIKKARLVHGNLYDYSKLVYTKSLDKICIICPEHGEFWQVAASHLQGIGCKKCFYKNKTLTTEDFIEKAKRIHGNKYDYSKFIYTHNKNKSIVICHKHGEFFTSYDIHLKGSICPKCNLEERALTTEAWINKANQIHDFKYDYSKVEYINCRTKIEIGCFDHGPFWQIPQNHLSGTGCPSCKESKNELKIRNWLESKNILFDTQKTFKGFGKYKFDFYLPDYNLCIEYDGEFHYLPLTYRGAKTKDEAINRLKAQNNRDNLKTKYCKDNKIRLIRIPYWKQKNIEEILEKEIKIC